MKFQKATPALVADALLEDCNLLKSRLMGLLVNRPLMASPRVAETIQSVIAEWDGSEQMLTQWERSNHQATRFAGLPVNGSRGLIYTLVDSVAVITVDGEMVNRGAWIGAHSGLVSYEGIDAQLHAAAADVRVKSILLDVNSPGGEAVGAMELAATVRSINATKPIFAFVNGMAASAAYAFVSGATKIITTPSGISGSIGVVLLHLDRSGELEMKGIKPTLIHAGAHKVDGNPFGPLSDAVKTDLQAEVMKFYGLFVDTVVSGRKGLTAESVRATEARTYIGSDAVAAGLVDAVSTFEDVLSEMQRAYGRSTVSKGVSMTDISGAPAAIIAGPSQDDVTRAAANATERITAIVTAEGISGDVGRTKVATKMAANSPMSADDIVAFVKDSVPAAYSVPSIATRAEENGLGSLPSAKQPRVGVIINPTAIYAARSKARNGLSSNL